MPSPSLSHPLFEDGVLILAAAVEVQQRRLRPRPPVPEAPPLRRQVLGRLAHGQRRAGRVQRLRARIHTHTIWAEPGRAPA